MNLTEVVESKGHFTDNFIESIAELREDCHRVTTQQTQVRTLIISMADKKGASGQMDYAENWSCKYQKEISAVYYNKYQVTINPMVVHNK